MAWGYDLVNFSHALLSIPYSASKQYREERPEKYSSRAFASLKSNTKQARVVAQVVCSCGFYE
jgi:hypothetical protein